jgi:hypothetical protein
MRSYMHFTTSILMETISMVTCLHFVFTDVFDDLAITLQKKLAWRPNIEDLQAFLEP